MAELDDCARWSDHVRFMISHGLRIWLMLLATASLVQAAGPQNAPPPGDDRGAELHVYLLTFGPGEEPFEKFGHNALRIIDDGRDDIWHDVAFNWGTFDFNAGKLSFGLNFLQGRLNYSMGITPGQPTINFYKDDQKRTTYQQELNLTSPQKLALLIKLRAAYFDDKQRFYRYDYFQNNCASRVRDVIDDLIDHRLAENTKGVPSGTTLRWQTARLTASVPWLYVLLQGAMGQPIDRPMDKWQEMFLPQKLHDRLNEVKVHVNGYDVPLVSRDETLYVSTLYPEPVQPPPMTSILLGVGVLFGAILAGLAQFAGRNWAARWGFILLSFPWLLLMGVGGSILWWTWLATDHVVARNNENVLQVSILALPLLILLPRLALGKQWGALFTQRLIFTLVGLALLGVALKVLPWFRQGNWPIIALCLPVNLALAYSALAMGSSKQVSPAKQLVETAQ